MKFGPVPVTDAAGAILAHSFRRGDLSLPKGRVLAEADIAALTAAGVVSVIACVPGPGDLDEDTAATRIAARLMGAGLTASRAHTGRVNLIAASQGVLCVDAVRIDALNLVDEAITAATLPAFATVAAGQIIATIKIIPYAVSASAMAAADVALGEGPALGVAAFTARRAVLIQTQLPGVKSSVLSKTVAVTRARLEGLGSTLIGERRVAHTGAAVAAAVGEAAPLADLVLIIGASAISDRRDVVPAGIVAAGGEVQQFGMPVDPGNLLLLARLGTVPVLGLPGCARSPKANGFDWVLARLCAGMAVDRRDIMRMGVGGLITEIASRPLPRAGSVALARDIKDAPGPHPTEVVPADGDNGGAAIGSTDGVTPANRPPARAANGDWQARRGAAGPRIGALILAAGRSTRMGRNKLVEPVEGLPMLAHSADAALESRAQPVVVVTGHDAAAAVAALGGRAVTTAHNVDFAEGLSTSLRTGIAALPDDVDGVVVMLGDMPFVAPETINALITAFNPAAGRAICLPVVGGHRGNPVLFDRRFFPEMLALSGDAGARSLVHRHAAAVFEVWVDDAGVRLDFDTPESLAAARGTRSAAGKRS